MHPSDSDVGDPAPHRAKRQRSEAASTAAPLLAEALGPNTYKESFQWAPTLVDSLLAREGADLKAKLQSSIGRRKRVLSTTYSCMGCPEQSLCMLKTFAHGARRHDLGYSLLRRHGQQSLVQASPPLEHMFGDIYSLVPVELREQLVQRQVLQWAAYKKAVAAKPKQRRVLREKCGFEFMQEACGILRQHTFDLGAKAFCSVHGHGCPLVRAQGSRWHG